MSKFKGISVIKGINKDSNPISSNGSGKSAVIEAIVFALFGRTIRKTRESSIIRNGAKSCLVCLTVDFGGNMVYIERGRKPSKLILTVNGEDMSRESALETQKYLEKYLNIDFTTFTTSIMFGQRNSANFITANPADKRKILQTFLGVDEYFNIREVINVKKRGIKKLQDEKVAVYKTCNKDLEDIDERIRIETEKQDLEDISDAAEMLDVWKTIRERTSKYTSINKDIGHLEKGLENLDENCPTCGEPWENEQYEKGISNLEDDILELYDELKDLLIPDDPKHSEKELKDYLAKKKFDTGLTVLEEMKTRKEADRDGAESEASKYGTQLRKLQYWEVAFSEQGIIKYLIKNIIDFFNSRSSHYLSLLTNGHLTIMFDQQLAEIIYSGKSKVEYNAMSGGESKKVQIAVMLALHDLLKFNGKVTPDFLFMDEITEIDRQGLRSMSSLMHTLATTLDKKVVLITHNSDLLSELKVNTTLTVVKQKGKTKIKAIKHV